MRQEFLPFTRPAITEADINAVLDAKRLHHLAVLDDA